MHLVADRLVVERLSVPSRLPSPLQNAALNGHDECVNQLIDAGADPSITTEAGIAPLYVAAQGGFGDSLVFILSSKHMTQAIADYNGNGNGATALYIAAQNGHFKCVRELVQAGVYLDPKMTSCGSTPLQQAIFIAQVRAALGGALQRSGRPTPRHTLLAQHTLRRAKSATDISLHPSYVHGCCAVHVPLHPCMCRCARVHAARSGWTSIPCSQWGSAANLDDT